MKILTTFFVGLFLTFCSEQESVLQQVQREGVLTILTRNSLTTYYEGAEGPTGFEYDLAKRFADELGVRLRILTAQSTDQIVRAVARRKANLGAAAIKVTPERKALVRFGPTYKTVTQQVVYRRGSPRPTAVGDLTDKQLEVGANTTHAQTLRELKAEIPTLVWREDPSADAAELLERVWQESADLTIADSNVVALTRRFYPELNVAFDVGGPQALAWAFPLHTDDSLYIAAILFFNRLRTSGELAQVIERHYGHVNRFDFVGTRTLLHHIRERLPRYAALFREAARHQGLDWRLLAAIGYQESHWNPNATSPTGVRGIMMLTRDTAKQVEIENRLDPKQSILGGAEYFARVKSKIPERISEPDRTWFALAAYNVGFGHLEDARKLAQSQGADPDKWIDVKRFLPLLSKKKWYTRTRHGYARGYEPVRYVQNVRRYFDMLAWIDRRSQTPSLEMPAEEDLHVPML